jgi:RNA polymerase sigma-70 factor (family 1)
VAAIRTFSDNELLSLLKDRDDAAFNQIFNQFYQSLCFFASRIVQDQYAAEDIIQDIFVKFWQRHRDFNDFASVRSFLYVSSRNACLNWLEKSQVKLKHQQYMVGRENIEERTILQTIIQAEVVRQIFDAVDTLPEQCRKVIRMTYEEGKKAKEIADELGITVSTVNNQKMRGLKLLRDQLSDEGLTLGMLLFIPGLLDILK